MRRLERFLLEPVNSLTHMAGALVALAGMTILLWQTRGEPGKMLSMFVYGSCLFVLYLASALFHGVRGSASWHLWLNRLDHAAIFLLIAGTYTPIVYSLLPGAWRLPALALIWLVALIGVSFKLFSRRIHGLIHVSIYVVLGWGGVLPLMLALGIATVLSLPGLEWLFLGGVIYSLGFVIFYRRRPDPWPGLLGHHEIWHFFVLGGSLCHYLYVYWYVASV